MTLDARRAYELERQLAEDRFTVYCPELDETEGPVTLQDAAHLLRGYHELQCPAVHTIELIEVTNDAAEPVRYAQRCDTCEGDEVHELLEIVSGIAKCLQCGTINDVDNDAIPEVAW
jgi:hypothetical protein